MYDLTSGLLDTYTESKPEKIRFIGSGLPGGKASGLIKLNDILDKHLPEREIDGMKVDIPGMFVILSDVFDQFMSNNNLYEIALSDTSDEEIALAFVNASIGPLFTGELYEVIDSINEPLAIRSSSICEDSMNEPFAGVYETKMIANNQFEKSVRFKSFVDAVKFVYASLFFRQSKEYFKATGYDIKQEKMAVIVQAVTGDHYGEYYHPMISGVLKSYNFYPSEAIKPDSGFAALAYGMGKTIVDGGTCWSYCPSCPQTPQPFNGIKDMLNNTQKKFWSVNLQATNNYNPVSQDEYMIKKSIFDKDIRGQLQQVCCSYDYRNDMLIPGIAEMCSPVMDFSPILKDETLPLNSIVRKIMDICENETNEKVEIEFAVSHNRHTEHKPFFSLLQLRPINISHDLIDVPVEMFKSRDTILSSDKVMGNGSCNTIKDIIYIKPEAFNITETEQIASDVSELNYNFRNGGRYLLIGFGRWGTSDKWCGIPVNWSQISRAKAIVETVLPTMKSDFSQGAHFFHNMTAHHVFYFSVNNEHAKNLDWTWIQNQKVVNETRYVRHVRLEGELTILVDGRTNRGVILK